MKEKLQENQTGVASQFLDSYISSYGMYMFVSDLPILSRAGIVEINNMMQPHGGDRMEEKHELEESTCVWQHSHAQHGNELSRIKLGFNKTRFTMRQTHVCEVVKGMR